MNALLVTYDPINPYCAPTGAFFGAMGVATSIVFANFGSAYGVAKGFLGVAYCTVLSPAKAFKSIIPCVMSAVLGIYGLIVSIIIAGTMNPKAGYSLYKGYAHLAAGLTCGLSCMAAGMSMGIVGDAHTRVFAKSPKIYTTLILIQCFQQALALYGVIVGMVLGNLQYGPTCATLA
eukprot:gene6272-10279_t